MKLERITKKYGNKTIFDNRDFIIETNKCTSLTGPSGSGKTTLLRILSGLDKEYSGKYIEKPSRIAVAFQEPRLFNGATVIENAALSTKKIKNASRILNELGIDSSDFELYPSSLSGGMARRISIARAIVYDAELYLIDEPFSGLDDESKEQTAKVLIKYLKNKTSVISTHDLNFAKLLDCHINLKPE